MLIVGGIVFGCKKWSSVCYCQGKQFMDSVSGCPGGAAELGWLPLSEPLFLCDKFG